MKDYVQKDYVQKHWWKNYLYIIIAFDSVDFW